MKWAFYSLLIFLTHPLNTLGQKTLNRDYLNDTYHTSKAIEWMHIYSEQAVRNNSIEFIAYDAWARGYLTDNKPFRIVYDKGELRIHGLSITADVNALYAAQIGKIFSNLNVEERKRKFKIEALYGVHFGDTTTQPKSGSDCRNSTPELTITCAAFDDIIGDLPDFLCRDTILGNYLCKNRLVHQATKVAVRCNKEHCWISDTLINRKFEIDIKNLMRTVYSLSPIEKEFVSIQIQPIIFKHCTNCKFD